MLTIYLAREKQPQTTSPFLKSRSLWLLVLASLVLTSPDFRFWAISSSAYAYGHSTRFQKESPSKQCDGRKEPLGHQVNGVNFVSRTGETLCSMHCIQSVMQTHYHAEDHKVYQVARPGVVAEG